MIDDFFVSKKDCAELAREGLSFVAYHYDNTRFDLSLFAAAGINLPENTQKSVLVRQAEFFAGRYCARQALSAFGIDAANIATGNNRQPLWPQGFRASISHTKTAAVCVAARDSTLDFLGIDIENTISAKTANSVKRTIINQEEEDKLAACGLSLEQGLTLAFSAKESIFKAAYGYVGRYFDFSAARLVDISLADRRLRMRMVEDLSAEIYQGLLFDIDFSWEAGTVTTLLAGCFGSGS